MIQRTIPVNVYPTTRELANELWKMDCVEQVNFLLALMQIYEKNFSDFLMQLEFVGEHKDKLLQDTEKKVLKDMLERFVEYLG